MCKRKDKVKLHALTLYRLLAQTKYFGCVCLNLKTLMKDNFPGSEQWAL